MRSYNDTRVRQANSLSVDPAGQYVLYWMQAYRRLGHNHALDRALHWSRSLGRPLVVFEGLRVDYPWVNNRLHRFMLDGMAANAARAAAIGITYWPFVETSECPARGLLRRLSDPACIVVTDDYPAFVVPTQTASLARRTRVAVEAIDGNSIVPLARLGPAVSAASHLRPRIHREFADAWRHRAAAEPDFESQRELIPPPFAVWNAENLATYVDGLPIDQTVRPVLGVSGGFSAGRGILREFVASRLDGYSVRRSRPAPPEDCPASGLSPYLRFGHLGIQEVAEAVLGKWDPSQINPAAKGKREGYFHVNPDVNAFLDEAVTWRDVGYHWHHHRRTDAARLDKALPGWAWATLTAHAGDRRPYLYSLDQLESADTHDEVWNAAQTELVATGRIHNYLRMLWGKKVIEWSATPRQAYSILEHLNNKYAYDGRDPNSYTGILWCFGLFDRPWPPERAVFGTVRYMSSDNTVRKFRIGPYLEYARRLGGYAGADLFADVNH